MSAPPLKSAFRQSETLPNKKQGSFGFQGFVFFAIVIFSVTVALYLFTQQIVTQRLEQERADRVEQAVSDHFAQIDMRVKQLGGIASHLSNLSLEELSQLKSAKAASEILDNVRPFNFIAYHELTNGNSRLHMIDRKVNNPDLKSLQAFALNKTSLTQFLKTVYDQYKIEHYVIQSRSVVEKMAYLGDTQGSEDKLLFVQPVQKQVLGMPGTHLYWLLAEEPVSRIFGKTWQNAQGYLSDIEIRNIHYNYPLYSYNNKGGWGRPSHQTQSVSHVYRGQQWEIDVTVYKSDLLAVVEYLPYACLAIGGFFTLISLLVAFLQRAQEDKIKRINFVLEEKNKALEREAGQREKLNSELKQSEAEHLALINSLGDIVFETDEQGNISFVNAVWTKITGYDLQQSKGANLFKMLDSNDQEAELDKFKALLSGTKSAYRSLTKLRVMDGSFRAVELSLSMVRRSENGALYVVGSITDTEERRRAEEALGAAERNVQEILDNAAWAIYQISPEGKLLRANPAMAKILGYNDVLHLSETVQDAFADLYPQRQERRQFLREIEQAERIHGNETQMRIINGDKIWVRENVRAVRDDVGNTVYYEGSFEDITDRKQADILLREAKMQSDMANKAKSEFLTNMSHELRTPLNAIIGFSEIIKTESFGPLGHESYKEYINEVYNGGKRLLNIVSEILDISKIELRERELNESSVNIGTVMDTCVSLFANQAEMQQVKIINNMISMPAVIAEERAMKQIFTNILSNAIKFTPRGGSVTLSNEINAAGDAVIAFADTGIGLEPDEIKKALSAFGQVGTSLDQENAGTGLGLTLVKSLIELHNGKVDIVSQKGVGTTVSITLPKSRVQ